MKREDLGHDLTDVSPSVGGSQKVSDLTSRPLDTSPEISDLAEVPMDISQEVSDLTKVHKDNSQTRDGMPSNTSQHVSRSTERPTDISQQITALTEVPLDTSQKAHFQTAPDVSDLTDVSLDDSQEVSDLTDVPRATSHIISGQGDLPTEDHEDTVLSSKAISATSGGGPGSADVSSESRQNISDTEREPSKPKRKSSVPIELLSRDEKVERIIETRGNIDLLLAKVREARAICLRYEKQNHLLQDYVGSLMGEH